MRPPDTMSLEMCATWASEVHSDTQERPDKKAARRHGIERSRMSRWRTIGKGSPCDAALRYVLRCSAAEAMRVAATFLSAARMVALKDKSTPELIALYWQHRETEVAHEADDARLDVTVSPWEARARASERDAATDSLLAAIERIFAARRVTDAEVFAGRPS